MSTLVGRPESKTFTDKSIRKRKRAGLQTPLNAHGEPLVWLTGGALAVCMAMIIGLFVLVFYFGFSTFWPVPVVQLTTIDGQVYLGEITRSSLYRPSLDTLDLPEDKLAQLKKDLFASDGWATRRLIRTGNFDLTGEHFQRLSDFEIEHETKPEWAMIFERLEWGRFYGFPHAFKIKDEIKAQSPNKIWDLYNQYHPEVRKRFHRIQDLRKHDVGKVNRILENERLHLREVKLEFGESSPEYKKAQKEFKEVKRWANDEFNRLRGEINELKEKNNQYQLVMETSEGQEHTLALADIVRGYPATRLSLMDKFKIYFSRWGEFLTDDPREANSKGGVYPAIFGTVAMTLIMSFAVVPFGVLAALYLREYAKSGPLVSSVRIAINNLAGVPSIVYGVFGLGFFCYMIGGTIDELFFEASLPNPTYGTGGLLWASLTLALLTLPVVIVATEETLAAVPSSMREGSYACGASKWQTIKRIVLPRAMPGIMTGMILAMARGAGEVAPLMLVGAVKMAPALPIDGIFPYLHPERSFMHLGFHIYDLGFQNQNSEAAKPMVYTTTLLLISIIFMLNIFAIWLRIRLRRRFIGSQF